MSEISFSITLPPVPLVVGDRVVLAMALENRGAEAMLVNARYAVAPQNGEVWPRVLRDGEELPFLYHINFQAVCPDDFVLLQPAERVVSSFPLEAGYDMSLPGDYEVSAVYVNELKPGDTTGAEQPGGRQAPAPVFTGRLTSAVEKLRFDPGRREG